MLDIAFELIGEATSNSLLMFCFCNLIIVIILTGSSKPGSTDSQDSTFTTSASFNMRDLASDDHDCGRGDDEEMIVVDVSSARDESLMDASSISDEGEDKQSSRCSVDDDDEEEEEETDQDDDDDDESEEADVEDEEGDDDLRKRVEEFIAKINNEWRHEKLKALNVVY